MDDLVNLPELLIKTIIIKNARDLGWEVNELSKQKYVLKKKIYLMSERERNTDTMLDMIFDLRDAKKRYILVEPSKI